MAKSDPIDEMARGCLMGRARLIARAVTQIYEESLRPFDLKPSQLNLLVVIAQEGPIRRHEIGRLIRLDLSTLTRNLQVMSRNGWVEEVADDSDGRGRPLQATPKGSELLADVAPAWRESQARARKLIGTGGASALMGMSMGILGAVPS